MSDQYARNLLPNPKPTDTADWAFYTSKDINLLLFPGNCLHITNQSGTPYSAACRMVRATTGRHDRANIPPSARALIHTLRLGVVA